MIETVFLLSFVLMFYSFVFGNQRSTFWMCVTGEKGDPGMVYVTPGDPGMCGTKGPKGPPGEPGKLIV